MLLSSKLLAQKIKGKNCVIAQSRKCHAMFSCSVVSDSLRHHGLYLSGSSLRPWGFSRQEYWSGLHESTRESSQPRNRTHISCIAGGFFTFRATREAQKYSSGQPIPSSRDLPDSGIKTGSPALQAYSLPAELPGKPYPLFICTTTSLSIVYICTNSLLIHLLMDILVASMFS